MPSHNRSNRWLLIVVVSTFVLAARIGMNPHAQDATLWGLFPHTHVRGKRWSYELELPDGTKRSILSVPRYDFNWQTYYMYQQPMQIPKGARIRSTAWYDNSAANRSNPDPTIAVKWGDQTWEEMQYTGIMYSVPRK